MSQYRVLKDPATMEFETVDVLPPGSLHVHSPGHGAYYRLADMLKGNNTPLHPPFGAALRAEMDRFARVFRHARPVTAGAWEDGFRCDLHPWRELAVWDLMAAVYERFTAHLAGDDEVTVAKRVEVFQVVLSLVNQGPAPDRGRVRFQAGPTLSARRVGEVYDALFGEESERRFAEADRRYRGMMQDRVLAADLPDRLTIDALCDADGKPNMGAEFPPLEPVKAADLIFGEDVSTGREFLVYGREFLERVVGTGEAAPARKLNVLVDADTDELERLVCLVMVVRGRHDYQAG